MYVCTVLWSKGSADYDVTNCIFTYCVYGIIKSSNYGSSVLQFTFCGWMLSHTYSMNTGVPRNLESVIDLISKLTLFRLLAACSWSCAPTPFTACYGFDILQILMRDGQLTNSFIGFHQVPHTQTHAHTHHSHIIILDDSICCIAKKDLFIRKRGYADYYKLIRPTYHWVLFSWL